MVTDYKPMVNHLTRISFQLLDATTVQQTVQQTPTITSNTIRSAGWNVMARMERVAAMMDLLAVKGFVFSLGRNYMYADSEDMEAQAAKRYLLDHGFHDQEFQVYLEYVRKWGVL